MRPRLPATNLVWLLLVPLRLPWKAELGLLPDFLEHPARLTGTFVLRDFSLIEVARLHFEVQLVEVLLHFEVQLVEVLLHFEVQLIEVLLHFEVQLIEVLLHFEVQLIEVLLHFEVQLVEES